jgi:hypothetical protein
MRKIDAVYFATSLIGIFVFGSLWLIQKFMEKKKEKKMDMKREPLMQILIMGDSPVKVKEIVKKVANANQEIQYLAAALTVNAGLSTQEAVEQEIIKKSVDLMKALEEIHKNLEEE